MGNKQLKFNNLLGILKGSLAGLPEHRRGQNGRYEIADAGLGAFAVFFMQAPSFLAHQRDMQRARGQNNAGSLFKLGEIPSDGQLRNLLDPVDPMQLGEPFWTVYEHLIATDQLAAYRGVAGTRLISLDGSQYFSSQKIHCANCRVTIRDGQKYYSHQVLLPVLSAPGQPHVIPLAPEFMSPQDGDEKQDCEQQAIKRWVIGHQARFAPWEITVLVDDLHSHQPTLTLLRANKMHFVAVCKPDSHLALYEEVALLERVAGAISTQVVRQWNGRYHERRVYRWVEQVPVRRGTDALLVNWCELTITKKETGEQLYHCAWVTDHALDAQTVVAVAASGRSRWKVENEGFNVLKNRGYDFEHNYGHGKQNLSSVLLTLLLLAFLFHTVLDLCCLKYQAVRRELGTRRTFFNDLRALTRYSYFASWDQLLCFMHQGLDLPVIPG